MTGVQTCALPILGQLILPDAVSAATLYTVLTVGLTEIPAKGAPLLQVYESAGLAVSDADCPRHMAVGPLMAILGLKTETWRV